MAGGNPRTSAARNLTSKLQEALSQLALREPSVRRSVRPDLLGAGGVPEAGWKEALRGTLHAAVDELVDGTRCAVEYKG